MSKKSKIQQIKEMKKRLLAGVLATTMLATSGCASKNDDSVPSRPIKYSSSSDEYRFDEYTRTGQKDNEVTKYYNSEYIYFLFDKNTSELTSYIYYDSFWIMELYDLKTEELLVYGNQVEGQNNKSYYHYLLNNCDQIYLPEINLYIEGEEVKKWYSLEEIEKLELELIEALKIIYPDNFQQKTKTKEK